ncbi:MAG: ribbon-helix-helix domain-containing protein [Rhizobiaceae bacterium]|nr:ribbon-helix-helix domain-containing protein [Rhizobiaceae bacterium]
MCQIFAGQAPERYSGETRSIRLGGHVTSVRLETAYWEILEEVSAAQGMALSKFLTTLHDEVLDLRGEVQNFASLLRCACLTYVEEVRGNSDRIAALKIEAQVA